VARYATAPDLSSLQPEPLIASAQPTPAITNQPAHATESVASSVQDVGQAAARLPALQALAAQLCCLLVTVPLAVRAGLGGMHPAVIALSFALLQGGLAMILARWRRLPSWWLAIQFAFPLAVVGANAMALPRWIYPTAFLLLLLTYWSTFRTRVPLYNCGSAVWREVSLLLPDGPVRFLDIGSGLGGVVLYLAANHPKGSFTGIEIAPLPWLISWVRARANALALRRVGKDLTGVCRFLRGDYGQQDLGEYDVVFAYLSPVAMPALWQKARREMLPGALLLSLEFSIPGVTPDFSLTSGDHNKRGKLLHGFRIPSQHSVAAAQ
jgi:SAM-dependent methyltransferase